MIRKVMMPLLLFCFLFVSAPADERDPLLTVDELLRLEPAYKQFLDDLCELLIEKGLLDRGEKEEWITMQLGDYLSNGGYGSILTSFYPGALAYARDEERICEPKVPLEAGVVSQSAGYDCGRADAAAGDERNGRGAAGGSFPAERNRRGLLPF